MTRDVKVVCTYCDSDVTVPARSMRVVGCTVPEWSYFVFECPRCAVPASHAATAGVAEALVGCGAVAESWSVPLEALERHDGPVIGYDDLLDFALAMSGQSPRAVTERVFTELAVHLADRGTVHR